LGRLPGDRYLRVAADCREIHAHWQRCREGRRVQSIGILVHLQPDEDLSGAWDRATVVHPGGVVAHDLAAVLSRRSLEPQRRHDQAPTASDIADREVARADVF
jgi:hypothetical protein